MFTRKIQGVALKSPNPDSHLFSIDAALTNDCTSRSYFLRKYNNYGMEEVKK